MGAGRGNQSAKGLVQAAGAASPVALAFLDETGFNAKLFCGRPMEMFAH
jgi:hypothetical protein